MPDKIRRLALDWTGAGALEHVHEISYVHVYVNMADSVNINISDPLALRDALATKLVELLGSVEWLRNYQVKPTRASADVGYDLEATLRLPQGKAVLAIECKKELRPSTFHNLADRNVVVPGRHRPVVPVLAMPFVSSRIADLCAQHGWSWYDLAGNCRIDVPNAVHLERRGNEPIYSYSNSSVNLGTPEASRVIRALLAPENAGKRWTQRSMESHFGQLPLPVPEPSLGLVNKVVKYLRDEAFIEPVKDGGFSVRDPIKLLFAWRDAYRFDRHDRRQYFTLLQPKASRHSLAKLDLEAGGFAAYASFSAAEFQAPHVRQPKIWLYISHEYIGRFEQLLEAKPVESGENLVVLVPNDVGVFYLADAGTVGEQRMACTNPVQTYVDLSHSGGRGKEAAEALLEQNLKPQWKQHKLL